MSTSPSPSPSPKTGLEALLTPEESVLVLIDHQPYQFANLHSHEPMMVTSNVVGLAKAAKGYGVPTILTTVVEDRGGLLIQPLQDVFPDQKPINRTFINTWEDQVVVDAVKATGRKKLILAGLWTEICVAMPAIQAAGEGFDVYVVTDASGGVSAEAHDMAVRRMVQAGVVPVTWLAVMGEWQRDWARTDRITPEDQLAALAHTGATGIATLWEQQLLNTPVTDATGTAARA
ncbi:MULTISPECIES: hydrolase [Streptomyces]|uniref:Hydrolase n=1 Tax=Streptomyces venezuelae TaxID=54571 RepID=A0A5P2BC32_STRVZ|nr:MULTISPECIES: hydrolase [Streptomyces]NDZ98993.1 hydrolase [Streptomyces sp. SID10116]MYY82346.1 isochorismatase family protein [Streptomyces sp. SID335]MYZ19351.1 isochorismatase family protein [Streptomyces sp. SID337]NDZ91300.1 hydrolase [Streptomyces sp. SID10115]NEB44044.1 hydrolase [Streptomyces sp. SID339]